MDSEKLAMLIEEFENWVVDLAEKDDGAIFRKATDRGSQAPVTYADLDRLMQIIVRVALGEKS